MRLLVFSDIHGDLAALRRLMETEADLYFAAGDLVNFARGFDKVGPLLATKAAQMYVIPGNHESESDIATFCAEYGLHSLHGEIVQHGGWNIGGLGYSNRTPFNTPGEYTEEQLAARLKPFHGVENLVMICHCPPYGTTLDEAQKGKHFGSHSIRDFIAQQQPKWFFCGHIHEAWGRREAIVNSHCVNAGPKGYLLELDTIKSE